MYIQRNYPSPHEHRTFEIRSMVGGLNNTDYMPRDHEAVLIKNMSFSDGDAMEKRKGTKYYNDVQYPEAVENIDYYSPYESIVTYERPSVNVSEHPVSDTSMNQAQMDDRLGKAHDAGFKHFAVVDLLGLSYLFVSHSPIVKAGSVIRSASDMLAYNNTAEEMTVGRSFDFTEHEPVVVTDYSVEATVRNHVQMVSTRYGLYADGVEVARTASSAQGVNYMGMYLFVDGERFRAYGSFAQEAGEYVKIIGTPTEDYIVMNVVDAPLGYEPLGEEHLVGVTVYDYENKQIWYEPSIHQQRDPYAGFSVVPKEARYMVTHRNRMFVSGNDEDDDNVYISDIDSPFYFPASLPLQPTPNADKVTKLIVFNDSVIVGRHHDVYAITGSSNNPEISEDLFRLKRVNTHTGFMNSTSANVVHNYLFYFGSDGVFYAMSSINQSDHLLITQILSRTLDMAKEPLNFSKADLQEATTVFFDNEWYVSFGNKALVYSYDHSAWTVYEGLGARSFAVHEFDLMWGTSDGRLVMYATDYLDLGEPFECRIETKSFDMGSPMLYKYFREFAVVAHTFPDFASDIRVSFEIDYTRVDHISKVKNQMSRWGISLWGDRFINNNINMSNPLPVHRRGRYIKFIFANGWDVQERAYSLGDLEHITAKVAGETLVWVELEGLFYLYDIDREWTPLTEFQKNQAMKVYEINGDYTLRSKR